LPIVHSRSRCVTPFGAACPGRGPQSRSKGKFSASKPRTSGPHRSTGSSTLVASCAGNRHLSRAASSTGSSWRSDPSALSPVRRSTLTSTRRCGGQQPPAAREKKPTCQQKPPTCMAHTPVGCVLPSSLGGWVQHRGVPPAPSRPSRKPALQRPGKSGRQLSSLFTTLSLGFLFSQTGIAARLPPRTGSGRAKIACDHLVCKLQGMGWFRM
jgi:hypothetical protein